MDCNALEHGGRQALTQPKQRTYLSFSAVSTFQSCPLRYYFRYVRGLPEEMISASLVFGSAIHAGLQFHFEQLLAANGPPSRDTLLEVFHDSWQQQSKNKIQFAKGEDINSLSALADRLFLAFQASDFSHPQGVILGVEEELRGKLVAGCPDLLARIDLIVDAGDSLTITDFKTSRRVWSHDQVSDASSQLLMYSELARCLSDGRPIKLQFAVMTKTKVPELLLHPVLNDPLNVERTKKVVERVWRAIQTGHFYPAPSALSCPSCPFRKPCMKWVG